VCTVTLWHVLHLKLKIYTTLIRPAVTYGCEAWTLTIRNEQQLRILERKILRTIFGPVQDENGIWRIRNFILFPCNPPKFRCIY
jgi:hypothetical protein